MGLIELEDGTGELILEDATGPYVLEGTEMAYGKVWGGGYLETHYELAGSASASGSSGYSSVGGGCFTYYRTEIGVRQEGVGIGMLLTDLGTYEGFARVPSQGLSKAYSAYDDLKARIYFDGIYAAEDHWLLKNCVVRIYLSGVLDETWTIGDMHSDLGGFAPTKDPAAVPLLAMPCMVQCLAGAAVTLHSGDTASASGTATGGWRWVIGGVTIAFPTTLDVLAPPANGGGCSVPALPTLVSTDTWDNSVTVSASVTSLGPPYSPAPEVVSDMSGEIHPYPDTARALERFEPDYSAVLIRGGLPRAGRESGSNCGAVTATASDTRIVQRAQYLDIVPAAAHPFDDAFGDDVECLYGASVNEGFNTGSNGAFSRYIGADAPPSGSVTIYDGDTYLRYFDYLANPHWSHAFWFEDWAVDSDPNPDLVNYYWEPGKHQWQHNALLSGDSVATDTRNIVPFDPLGSCRGPAGWWENYVSHNFRQLGACRWHTVNVTPKTSHTYDSGDSALFTDDDCSLSHGATITVTPDALQTVMDVFLDLASYTAEPYMWPQIADQLKLDWTATNIVSVKTFMVGLDGEEVEVPIAKNTWTDIPRGPSVKYAGSWGIYNGVDGVVDDTGVDLSGDGISSAVMGSAETAGAFQLLPGSTRTTLRIEVTVTDPAIPVSIGYPQLRRDDGRDPMVAWESGQCAVIMWPDFSAVRFGNESWWNYTTDALRTTPTVNGLGHQTTIVDAYCWANVWLMGQAPDTGLAALAASLFDTVEGNTVMAMAYNTAGVLLPDPTWTRFQFAMMNLLAEVPPLLMMPRKERDSDWAETGGYVLNAYSETFGTLRLVTPGSVEPELIVSGSKWSTLETGWPSGFSVAGWQRAVVNDEWGTVRHGGNDLATVRPWHGYYHVYDADEPSAGGVSYDVSRAWQHRRAAIVSGDTWVGSAGNAPIPLVFADYNVVSGGDWCSIRLSKRSLNVSAWMAVEAGGIVTLYKSIDGGASFSSFASIGAGSKPSLCTCETGEFFLYWRDGGALKGQMRDAVGNVVVATFTAVAAVDDEGCAAYEVPGIQRKIALLYVVGGNVTRRVSSDGVTFGGATAIEAGKKPAGCCSRDGKVLECWVSGTTVHGRRLDPVGNAVSAISTWVASGVDDAQIAVQWSSGSAGLTRAVLLYASSGAIAQKKSYDGSAWT